MHTMDGPCACLLGPNIRTVTRSYPDISWFLSPLTCLGHPFHTLLPVVQHQFGQRMIHRDANSILAWLEHGWSMLELPPACRVQICRIIHLTTVDFKYIQIYYPHPL